MSQVISYSQNCDLGLLQILKKIMVSKTGYRKKNLDRIKPLRGKLSNLDNKLFAASLQRLFSGFGLVQYKLHNRLGSKKADELTFIRVAKKPGLFI